MKWMTCVLVLSLMGGTLSAGETFVPITQSSDLPQTVSALWKDYDPRKESLDIRIIKEWRQDDVVTRYVTFKVGTFKGVDSRIAAYYSFPDNRVANPAFVWSHGGGQRAERQRGVYFAKQGFATVDINWLGRPMEEGIDENTDWGNVDPTQGPRFYSKAKRESWKMNLQPDQFTIDPVASPRNSNWFLLAVAARRAITFLEQQSEVDVQRIGFAGYSMGGMITALTAPDPRLKAVVPFVGGTGFKDEDLPGITGSSIRPHFRELKLYQDTIDAKGYWPLTTCPVMFISSTNDFHSVFDRIYRSMALVRHSAWRVTTNVHENHGPGPEQWVLLNLWFDQYLKGVDQKIPGTPASKLSIHEGKARFSVTPDQQDRLLETNLYYSYDPNARTRFWNRATTDEDSKTWSVELPVYGDLPLYVFATCRYQLDSPRQLERGETSTFALNSLEHVFVPDSIESKSFSKLVEPKIVFEDFSQGIQDWSSRNRRSIKTYKFQNPALDRSNTKKLVITIDPQHKRLILRLNADSKFLSRENNLGEFSLVKKIEGDGPQEVSIDRREFKNKEAKELEWSKVATFTVTLIDASSKQPIDLTSSDGQSFIKRIELAR